MAVVLAVHAELKARNFSFIDFLFFAFYSAVLSSLFFGPLGIVELYLYRQKKGVWYEWKNRKRNGGRDRARNFEERTHWKNEAVLMRLKRGDEPRHELGSRTALFAGSPAAGPVSRAALLMRVARKFEQSGKRRAAGRCYEQVAERFADTPEAAIAARELSSVSDASGGA